MALLIIGIAIAGTCVYTFCLGGIFETYIRWKQYHPM
jgi:hypothetical protein